MLQEKTWLECKWDKYYTVLIEKTVEKNEELTQFWLTKENYGVIDFMFAIPGHLNNPEIEDYIEKNIYEYMAQFEMQYN